MLYYLCCLNPTGLLDVCVHWICKKHVTTCLHSNHSELTTILQQHNTTLLLCHFLHVLGHPQQNPTILHCDNQPAITEIIKDHLASQVRHLDVMITYLHEHYILGYFHLQFIPTHLQKVDINTKLHGGEQIRSMILDLIGFQFYTPPYSAHYKLLHLHIYNISYLLHKNFLNALLLANHNVFLYYISFLA